MVEPGKYEVKCPQCGSPFLVFVVQNDIREYLNNPQIENSWKARCCKIDIPIQQVFDMIINGVEVEPW